MRERYRYAQTTVQRHYSTGENLGDLTGTEVSEYFKEIPSSTVVASRRLSSCVHRKCLKPATGSHGEYFGINHASITNYYSGNSLLLPSEFLERIAKVHQSHLKKAMAADNNDFELIPFLTDWDSTLGIFIDKIKYKGFRTNYGEITWGILPFIRDVAALVQSLQDLVNKYSTYPKCTTVARRTAIHSPYVTHEAAPDGVYLQQAFASVTTSGVLTFHPLDLTKGLNRIRLILDELGVHPDLRTAWDIVPLSFVADYFLPIGAALDSLHPRGWGSTTYTFVGTQSYKIRAILGYQNRGYRDGLGTNDVPCYWTYYMRSVIDGIPEFSVFPPDNTPSLQEIFNVGYLSGLLRPLENHFNRTPRLLRR